MNVFPFLQLFLSESCIIFWQGVKWDIEVVRLRRAGYKLEAALEQFALDVKGKIVLDAGLSTGGFTDCLLQNGVAQVYGVDVGYGQVKPLSIFHQHFSSHTTWDVSFIW